jgi:hypothetical protein
VGVKAQLEYDFFFLAEAHQWTWQDILQMPVGLRHKAVKFHEEVVRIRNEKNGEDGAPGRQQAARKPSLWSQAQAAKKG